MILVASAQAVVCIRWTSDRPVLLVKMIHSSVSRRSTKGFFSLLWTLKLLQRFWSSIPHGRQGCNCILQEPLWKCSLFSVLLLEEPDVVTWMWRWVPFICGCSLSFYIAGAVSRFPSFTEDADRSVFFPPPKHFCLHCSSLKCQSLPAICDGGDVFQWRSLHSAAPVHFCFHAIMDSSSFSSSFLVHVPGLGFTIISYQLRILALLIAELINYLLCGTQYGVIYIIQTFAPHVLHFSYNLCLISFFCYHQSVRVKFNSDPATLVAPSCCS